MTDFLSPLDAWLDAPAADLREKAFEASQFAATEIADQGIKADAARDIVIRFWLWLNSERMTLLTSAQ